MEHLYSILESGLAMISEKKVSKTDFRLLLRCSAFKIVTLGLFLQGAQGGRYRYALNKYLFVDGSIMAVLAWGQDWNTSQYHRSILPVVLLGGGYRFENGMTAALNFNLSPVNQAFHATSGFWIVLAMLQLSFPVPYPTSAH